MIVEHGTLRKSRHLLPKAFVEVHEPERVVRATVTKDIIESSPKLDGDAVDERAVAEHYGLAAGYEAPSTEGYGELLPDDPARSAEEDEQRLGLRTAEQDRLRVQQADPSDDRGPESPGLLGERNPS